MTTSENGSNRFDALYKQYEQQVYRLSLKYSDFDYDLAEDATQYTFMKLFLEMEKGVEFTNVLSYLHTVVKNHTINCKIKGKREFLMEDFSDSEVMEVREQEPSAEAVYLESLGMQVRSQILEALLEEMKAYNDTWYTIIMEVYYRERSQVEVAEELGMSNTAMYATIKRIRNWSKKNQMRIESNVRDKLKEVPQGTSFGDYVE